MRRLGKQGVRYALGTPFVSVCDVQDGMPSAHLEIRMRHEACFDFK